MFAADLSPVDPLEKRDLWRWLALLTWVIPLLVVSAEVAIFPNRHTVTPVYHNAVAHWNNGEALYDGAYHYLPHFVPIFMPFHAMPVCVGDVLWRLTGTAGLAWGLWWFTRSASDLESWRAFGITSLITLPLMLPAINNGQANVHLSACLLLSAICLTTKGWWGASIFLLLGAAIKPLGLAAAGLAVIAFPEILCPFMLGSLFVIFMPFLLGPTAYVKSQLIASANHLRESANVTENRFADLNGLLMAFGCPLKGILSTLVRAVAGLGFMVFIWKHHHLLPARRRALAWVAASSVYLMIFNPMTEANSYVILAPIMGLMTWQLMEKGRKREAFCIAAMLLSMGLLPNTMHHWLGNAFALAWHPLMALIFAGMVVANLDQGSSQTNATAVNTGANC